MGTSARQKLIEQVHASGKRLVLSLTGGGSGAIAAMLQVPGASASVLDAVVPYSGAALRQWLGGPIDQHCSAKTARAMAMRAFERARELSDNDPFTLHGIGATASLATNRPKRGPHRIHVAWQSAVATSIASCRLIKEELSRAEEEEIATQMVLQSVAEACGLAAPELIDAPNGTQIERQEQRAPGEWSELLLGSRTCVAISEDGKIADRLRDDETARRILFPGAFNPPHWGHEQMAQIAAQRYGGPVTYELSVKNVDKPPLDFIEIADRLEQLAGRRVLLTRAATFVDKASVAPGCIFIVGTDTIERIADPIYYIGNPARRDAAIAELAERGCRFLVFGRTLDGEFSPLSEIDIPPTLRALCEEVSEAEFRADVASTDLRHPQSG